MAPQNRQANPLSCLKSEEIPQLERNSSMHDPMIAGLLGIRQRVLFPAATLRLTIGRVRSSKLVENLIDESTGSLKKNSMILISSVIAKKKENQTARARRENIDAQGEENLFNAGTTLSVQSGEEEQCLKTVYLDEDSIEVYRVGTLAHVLSVNELVVKSNNPIASMEGSIQDTQYHILVRGVARARILSIVSPDPYYMVQFELLLPPIRLLPRKGTPVLQDSNSDTSNTTAQEATVKLHALEMALRQATDKFFKLQQSNDSQQTGNSSLSSSSAAALKLKVRSKIQQNESIVQLADLLVFFMLEISVETKQKVLEEIDLSNRLELVLKLVQEQVEILKMSNQIQQQMVNNLQESQRQYLLKQKMIAIEQLSQMSKRNAQNNKGSSERSTGPADEEEENDFKNMDEGMQMEYKIKRAQLPPEVREAANRDITRLLQLQPAQAEYAVIFNYLEWILDIPWCISTIDNLNIAHARQVLNQDHFALEKVKKRIVEFLAVRSLQEANLKEKRMQEMQQTHSQDGIQKQPSQNADAVKTDVVKQASTIEISSPSTSKSTKNRSSRTTSTEAGAAVVPAEHHAPILCLVGAPGVGKTSLGKSIARALNRKFARIALGGVRDEAEIRGHRRTYIGAFPGNIIQALKKSKSNNPVILLDEVDKLGREGGAVARGDPSSALLEVLDPEQNAHFQDHYMNVPVDLSKVLFVATANTLESVPAPLLDRMEIIHVPGYTIEEKIHIAQEHLWPKQLARHGLSSLDVLFDEKSETWDALIHGYTREAGVRVLEQRIAALCRTVAVKVTEVLQEQPSKTPEAACSTTTLVNEAYLTSVLGPPMYESEKTRGTGLLPPGVATGLAWTPVGGEILFVEASIHQGTGKLLLTGQVGKVMNESVQAALSFIRAHMKELGLLSLNNHNAGVTAAKVKKLSDEDNTKGGDSCVVMENIFHEIDIHVHFPAGAVPKDGPSAGVAVTAALVSTLSGYVVREDTACTGEITLRGSVLPVGGIKEKLLAAHRAGIKRVLLPRRNEKDLWDISSRVIKSLDIVFVERMEEAIQHLIPQLLPDETEVNTTPAKPIWKRRRNTPSSNPSAVVSSTTVHHDISTTLEVDSKQEDRGKDYVGDILVSNL